MKRVLPFIVIPYLLMMGVIFYFYFGPSLFGGYEPLKWQGVETRVPEKFQAKIYHSKGWEVYSLQKMGTLIKIAVKDVFDVTGLPRYYSDIQYQVSTSPGEIFLSPSPVAGVKWYMPVRLVKWCFISVCSPHPLIHAFV